MFSYYMPTKILVGDLKSYCEEFRGYGKKAFIVTGKSSANNGSLKDVLQILEELNLGYAVFDQIEENPSLENVAAAAETGIREGIDFIIGIGGGSPLDASKAIAVLISNPGLNVNELFSGKKLSALPFLAVPTTAGTGSETTPFAVLTVHEKQTKISMSQLVFAEKAFLNSRYMENMPEEITLSTAVDAFTHLVEGYLTGKANFLSDRIAESGFGVFVQCMPELREKKFTPALREKLLLVSSLAGMVITQAKTSLPHQMGYALTYFKNVPHGFACGITLYEYLKFHGNQEKVNEMLKNLKLENLEALREFLRCVITVNINVTQDEISAYANKLFATPEKLQNHPYPVTLDNLIQIYTNSL